MSNQVPPARLRLRGGGRWKRVLTIFDRSYAAPWVILEADSFAIMVYPEDGFAPVKGDYMDWAIYRERCRATYVDLDCACVAPSPHGMKTRSSVTFCTKDGDAFVFAPADEDLETLLEFLDHHAVSVQHVERFIHPRTRLLD